MTHKRKWKCEQCGGVLPKRGFVWRHRYDQWRNGTRHTSGYYCDVCADARENGYDMEC